MGIHESEIFEGKFKSVTTCATRVMPERDVGHMPMPGTVFPGSVFAHVCEWRQLLDTTQENTIRQVLNKPKKLIHSATMDCEGNVRRGKGQDLMCHAAGPQRTVGHRIVSKTSDVVSFCLQAAPGLLERSENPERKE